MKEFIKKVTKLRRSINLPLLTFYGLGTIVGGGIYALLGKVAGEAGMSMPIAFALAGFIALFSACSFAELCTRFPTSAGEAAYILKGFNNYKLSFFVGMLVIFTGIVSASTLVVATTHFLSDAWPIPNALTIICITIAMGMVAIWGIGQSAVVIAIITIIEVGGLLYICAINIDTLQLAGDQWRQFFIFDEENNIRWTGIFAGAFLAFYAFIGFEDMVNIAEEVNDVERVMPKAIFLSIGIATLLYVVISTIAVLLVPLDILQEANTPLTLLVPDQPSYILTALWLISILAGVNGALVQIIMASRVTYGLSKNEQCSHYRMSQLFAYISPKTHTPVVATIFSTACVIILALFFPIETLAKATSTIVFLVFFLVNAALYRLKRMHQTPEHDGITFSSWVPLTGGLSALAMLLLLLFL